jgi:hypothetical protein
MRQISLNTVHTKQTGALPPPDNPVINQEQASQLLAERAPRVPVEYEAAVRSLAACCTLDEARYWSNKADALAAWSRIFRSNEAQVNARRLKLHAYRRMNELAEELRPQQKGAAQKGPWSLLREQGLKASEITLIRRIGHIPEPRFKQIIEQKRPPAIVKAAIEGRNLRYSSSERWLTLMDSTPAMNLRNFLVFTARFPPSEVRCLKDDEAVKVRAAIRTIQEWLDDLERFLPSVQGSRQRESTQESIGI